MIGGVTRHILPHLSAVLHLNVNRPLVSLSSVKECNLLTRRFGLYNS